MAFGQLLNQDDEDPQLQQGFAAPTGGSTAIAAPASFAQPQAQPATGGGTGFVNLQRYMDASGNDRAGQVRGAAQGVMEKEEKRFNDAADPLRSAVAAAPTGAPTSDDISNAFNNATATQAAAPIGEGAVVDENARAKEADDIKKKNDAGFKQLQDWLGASFTAPTVEYSPEQSSAATMFNLMDPANAAREVNKGAMQSEQPYSLGNELLDRALFEGDAGVRGETDAAKKSIEDFDKRTFDEVTSLNERAQKADTAARDTRAAVKTALGQQWDATNDELDALVKAANEQEALGRAAHGDKGTWQGGTGATRENTANDAQRAKFAAIAKLLGIDDLGQTQRTTGTFTPEAPAPKEPQKSWGEGIDPFNGKKYFESTMKTRTGRELTPEEQAAKDKAEFDAEVDRLAKEGYSRRQAAEMVEKRRNKAKGIH